jgi:hypothetical protein
MKYQHHGLLPPQTFLFEKRQEFTQIIVIGLAGILTFSKPT